MKLFIVAVVSALVAVVVADKIVYYKTDNDNLDVDAIMKNPVLVKQYMDCFLDKGSCDPLGESYKKIIPDAVATACWRCDEAQKRNCNRFLWNLKNKYPAYYEAFQNKYDPDNIYIAKLKEAIAKY